MGASSSAFKNSLNVDVLIGRIYASRRAKQFFCQWIPPKTRFSMVKPAAPHLKRLSKWSYVVVRCLEKSSLKTENRSYIRMHKQVQFTFDVSKMNRQSRSHSTPFMMKIPRNANFTMIRPTRWLRAFLKATTAPSLRMDKQGVVKLIRCKEKTLQWNSVVSFRFRSYFWYYTHRHHKWTRIYGPDLVPGDL